MKSFLIALFSLFATLALAQLQQLPIMAFYGVDNNSDVDYQLMSEAGINVNFTVFSNVEEGVKALNVANKHNVKIMFYADELVINPEQTIKKIKNHPGLYGYFVDDEPTVKDFEHLKSRISVIQSLDPNHPVYINLFPNSASSKDLGENLYVDYLKKFVTTVPTSFISFDYYPVKRSGVESMWYSNLEIIRNISIAQNKPFWGFANSTVFGPYPQPTIESIRLQQFGNLLYGAKGLQYFTYLTLDDANWKKNNMGHAIVYSNGKPTPTYNVVKTVNTQIQKLAWVFIDSTVRNVYHMGNDIPKDTKVAPPSLGIIKTYNQSSNNLLVSCLDNKKYNFVAYQNKNLNGNMKFNFKPDSGVMIVDNTTGKLITLKSTKQYLTLLPGDVVIFAKVK